MAKIPIEAQLEAVKTGELGPAYEAAIKTLTWLRDNPETVKFAALLHQDDRVRTVLDHPPFAGAEVVAIRRIDRAEDNDEDY